MTTNDPQRLRDALDDLTALRQIGVIGDDTFAVASALIQADLPKTYTVYTVTGEDNTARVRVVKAYDLIDLNRAVRELIGVYHCGELRIVVLEEGVS